MRILVTGSAGHLGEALMRTFANSSHDATGLDIKASAYTTHVGSLCDRDFVTRCTEGMDFVLHTATLHKPHVGTHSRQEFVDTNVTGTLSVLEAAVAARVTGVVYTSTTSAFGASLIPGPDEPAAWIDEDVVSVSKNIYGATKQAAEERCQLLHRTEGLPTIVLRTSRFFPEADDNPEARSQFNDMNLKTNEFLHRRLEVKDAVSAHLKAIERVEDIGFGRYVVSATSPFRREHLGRLRGEAGDVVRELFPDAELEYKRRGWSLPTNIGRVYVNQRARDELGWAPKFDFRSNLDRLKQDEPLFSLLAADVGLKGYHKEVYTDGLYPVKS